VFLIPLHTAYIIRQGPIGNEGLAREGIWQFGTIALYVTDILFFLIMMCAGLEWYFLRKKNVHQLNEKYSKNMPLRMLAACFLCIAIISIFWSFDKLLAVQATVRLCEGIFIFFLLLRMPSKKWNMLEWVFIASACIQGILGGIQFFMQEIPAVSWLGSAYHAPFQLGDAVVENGDVRWLRAYGSFPHPNILAAYLVMGYFFCIARVMQSEKKIHSFLATFAGACILFGLMLTFSRSAWTGLIVGMIVFAGMYWKKERHGGSLYSQPHETRRYISPLTFFSLVSIVTVIFSGILFFEPLSVRIGAGGWKRLEIKSAQERVGSMKEFLSLDSALWRGTGIGHYTHTLFEYDIKNHTIRPSYAYQPVHNIFFVIIAELGIVGGILFLGFLGMLFLRIRQKNILGIGILISFMIIGFFDHFFWTLHASILMWWVCMAWLDKKYTIM
jgi:hypothetical protein